MTASLQRSGASARSGRIHNNNNSVMRFTTLLFISFLCACLLAPSVSLASSEKSAVKKESWSFRGIFGHFEKASLRRGYEVYDQVCASCHGLRFLHYRDLEALDYSRAQIAALAARLEVEDGPNDTGELYSRSALPSDRFVSPFANDEAARFANNGALPPDLSLIVTQAGGKGGADFIYALLTGYADPPADFVLAEGLYYNKVFKGHAIAMPPPLFEGMIAYSDGEKASIERMAHDVTQFLAWASDPSLEVRKRMGLRVLIFLAVFFVVAFLYKRRVWARVR